MRKNLLMVSLAVCCAFVLSSSVVEAKDHWVGTWTLDAAKSTYSPGPAQKSMTLTFVETKDGIKLNSDGVGGDGAEMHAEYVSRFDGKDVPWTGNPDADTANAKKINDHSYENTWKKGGKTMMTAMVVVSADGKTLTATITGTNAKGQAVKNVVVYNKK